MWLRAGGGAGEHGGEEVLPAALRPDLAHHCWRAVLHVSDPSEVRRTWRWKIIIVNVFVIVVLSFQRYGSRMLFSLTV